MTPAESRPGETSPDLPHVRPARLADAGAIAGLTDELGYPTSETEMAERLATLLADADQAVVVAEQAGSIVAWIQVGAVRALESGAFAEIRGLVVTETHRGRGIGRALIAEAERWARLARLSRIRVRSREARADAHRFYLGLGYAGVKTQRVFDKRLDCRGR